MRGVFIILFFLGFSLSAQEVLNGSFENHTFTPLDGDGCNFDHDCYPYHQKMAHSNAWETEAPNPLCFVGVMHEGCTQYFNPEYVWGPPPQHGQWSVVIYGSHLQSSWGSYSHRANAISLALSSPLEVGISYALSYYILAPPPSVVPEYVVYNTTNLSVGISEKDTSFGEHIHTSIIPDSIWRWQSVIFEASIPAEHIAFKINVPITETDVLKRYGVFIDNVSISTDLALAEAVPKPLTVYPNPSSGHFRIEGQGVELVVHDLLGRERYRAPLHGRHSLFIHDWPQGIYMVKTLNLQGQPLATQKLIKTN